MEKYEVFPLHSATSHAVGAFPSNKADHPPNSSSGLHHHSTVLHASPVSNSRTLPYQLPTCSHLGRHSTESPIQRAGRPHLRSDEIFNYHRAPITHKEISKFVEKILQAQITEQQKWTPPSRDYMDKPLTCQTCKTTITKVDTTLVCDACEKGYHLKCLHYIPKSFSSDKWQDWHCVKCLSITNGKRKALPPKYGPVITS